MKTIGLVINGSLSYSHTFILNEIKVWRNIGYNVVLFTGYSKKKQVVEGAKVLDGLPLSYHNLYDLWTTFYRLIHLFFYGSTTTIRFFTYEKRRGTTTWNILKRIYKVAHILPVKVDFLHYGFANVALNKEYLAKAMNAKMSVSLRGADIVILPLTNPSIYQEVWNNADKVRSISSDLYQSALTYGWNKEKDKHVIFQTLDLEQFPDQKKGIKNEQTLEIVTVARLHWKKGIEYGLTAIANLKKEGVKLHYTIVGSGEHEQAILFMIKEMKLENDVTLTGALPFNEVLLMMRKADVYLQPSLQEGFCSAVLEAQALGLLVVACLADGMGENIVHQETGWIVPKRDVSAIVQMIKYIINMSDEEKAQIGLNARERVEKQFKLNAYEKEWASFFS